MKAIIKILASLLLLVNGIGAIYGGWHLMGQPDGSSLKMPLDMLKHSPFDNYLIPGVILTVANGLFSLFVFGAVIFNFKKYPMLIIAQGVILTGWIFVQVIMIRAIDILHIIYATAGLLLITGGWIISRNRFYDFQID